MIAGASRHDSPLLRPTPEKFSRFGFDPPDDMRLTLDAGYGSIVTRELLDKLGFDGLIQPKGEVVPINHTRRQVVERTNSWNSRGFNIVTTCTERRAKVIEAFFALINATIVTRRLIRGASNTHHWGQRPARRPLPTTFHQPNLAPYPRDL